MPFTSGTMHVVQAIHLLTYLMVMERATSMSPLLLTQTGWQFNSAFYDGNADLHIISNYSAYSLTYVNQGAFYTGTGVPPSNQYDAWSAMAEEIGHGQNMNHFGSACYTMSGITPNGSTCKRVLTQQEIDAACEPYRLVHGSC